VRASRISAGEGLFFFVSVMASLLYSSHCLAWVATEGIIRSMRVLMPVLSPGFLMETAGFLVCGCAEVAFDPALELIKIYEDAPIGRLAPDATLHPGAVFDFVPNGVFAVAGDFG
jgi:hypothetical protein